VLAALALIAGNRIFLSFMNNPPQSRCHTVLGLAAECTFAPALDMCHLVRAAVLEENSWSPGP